MHSLKSETHVFSKIKRRLKNESMHAMLFMKLFSNILKFEYKKIYQEDTMTICYNKLWKLLIDKNMSRSKLAKQVGISTNAMSHMSKNEPVRLETLIKICGALDCKIDDIVDYSVE